MVLKLWIVTLGKVVKEFRGDLEILLKEKVISCQQFVSSKVREWEQTIVTSAICPTLGAADFIWLLTVVQLFKERKVAVHT